MYFIIMVDEVKESCFTYKINIITIIWFESRISIVILFIRLYWSI